MKCPHCDFTSDELVCPQCRHRFGSGALEELSHLGYSEALLETWFQDGSISPATYVHLLRLIRVRRSELQTSLGVAPGPEAAPEVALRCQDSLAAVGRWVDACRVAPGVQLPQVRLVTRVKSRQKV